MTENANDKPKPYMWIVVEFADKSSIGLPLAASWDGRVDMLYTKPDAAANFADTDARKWGPSMIERATNVTSVRIHLD